MGENIAKRSALVLNSGERGGRFRSSERPLGTAGRSGGRFRPLSGLSLPAAPAWSERFSADSVAVILGNLRAHQLPPLPRDGTLIPSCVALLTIALWYFSMVSQHILIRW